MTARKFSIPSNRSEQNRPTRSRSSLLDVHDRAAQKQSSPPRQHESKCGLILMCMMPRAISRESATCVDTVGRLRTAGMLDCKEFDLAWKNMHGTWCRAD